MDGHPTPAMSERSRERLLILGLIVAALLLSLKYFPGLENEVAYSGNAYQIIHPDAFAGDPYRGPEHPISARPLQLTAMYALVKAVGDLWLDDRFVFLVYWGLVAVGLAGIDRTAKLLGANGITERAIILLMFLKDHAVLDHSVRLAHHQDVNHMAFAIPIIIWLIYVTLARKDLGVVLAISAVLTAFSIRNAAIPVSACLIITAVLGARRERMVVAALFIAGLAIAYWGLFHFFAVPEMARLELWEHIKTQEEGDANPFLGGDGHWVRVSVWGAIVLGGYLACRGDSPAHRGARLYLLIGALTFLVGGAYISFAPDAIKFPLLIGFAPNRALAWVQNLAYIAIVAGLFRWAGEQATAKAAIIATAVILVLFIVGPGNHVKWLALTASASVLVVAVYWIGRPEILARRRSTMTLADHLTAAWPVACMQTLVVVLGLALAKGIVDHRAAIGTMLADGVWGDSASAPWIGVAEYVRDNTPAGVSILPLTYADAGNTRLTATRSLGTRAGRAMPVPEVYGADFRSPAAWQRMYQQLAVLEAIEKALMRRDFAGAAESIEHLLPFPDYILLPEGVLDHTATIGPYRLAHRIRGYALLKRQRR